MKVLRVLSSYRSLLWDSEVIFVTLDRVQTPAGHSMASSSTDGFRSKGENEGGEQGNERMKYI